MDQLPPAPWGKPWFYQKSFGYGAGLPCSREGWIVYGVYAAINVAVIAAFALIGRTNQPLAGAVLFSGVMLTAIPVVVIAWGRTAGGWRWRLGK